MKRIAKKHIKIYIIIAASILIVWTLFRFVYSYINFSDFLLFDNFVKVKLDSSTGMNTEQRVKDFDFLCKELENQVPMIYDYEELYGIKYEDIKSIYKQRILNCSNDYQYYSYIDGFLNNIPSCHISLQFPDINYMSLVHKFIISENYTVPPAEKYWNDVLHNECIKYYEDDVSMTVFFYFSGKYIGHTEDNNYPLRNSQLISINGVEVNEFIKTYSSTQKLKYDHVEKKPYREYICLNNSFGEECTIEYKDERGKLNTKQMFCGTIAEEVLTYVDYYKSLDNNTLLKNEENKCIYPYIDEADYSVDYLEMKSATMVRDKQRKLVYITIKDFSGTAWCVAKMIENTSNEDTIILDVRSNPGGYKQVCDGILSELITSDLEINDSIYISSKITDELKYSGVFENTSLIKKQDGLYLYLNKTIIPGKAKGEKNIFVLVNGDTCSAADRFAMIIKNNKIGTIIGSNNTGGECYGSPYFGVLKESGLIFYYPYNKYLNTDGTDNSVYGTCPDIYINYEVSNYEIRNDLLSQGKDLNTYESKLKYDEVLIKALDLINDEEIKE